MGLLLQSSCRMVLFQLSVLLMLASTHSHPHKRQADDMDHGDMNMAGEEECCDQKMVGEDRYFNIGYDHNGMTFNLNCLSPCIFEKEDQPGSKYCFAAGDMKVECEDDMDFTPTGGPRPTEGPDGNGATDDNGEGPDGGVTGDGGTTGGSNTGSKGYTQAWLRGPGDFVAHVHEGLELADASGFVAVGETSDESNFGAILVTRVDTEANKVWSQKIGTQLSAAHTVVESGSNVIVGGGLYSASTGKMQATLIALDSATGSTVWTKSLDHSGHGAIRGVILDSGSLVATGYVGNNEGGFLFIADGDNAKAMAWKFDLSGNLLTTTQLGVDGMQQGAKIRADPVNGGYAIAGSVWMSDQQGIVVKLNSDLSVAWSQDYGLSTGADQVFDLVVDSDGNYLLGGHTTAGVTNWDYLAIKVDGATKQELWRRTYGQPRGFDARYIHDEMWGVSMDPGGNYLLLGGSGDEYSYSATSGGWASDIWVSYLVVVGKDGDKLYEGIYGNQAGNEAGEYPTVTSTGDIMIYTDSDTTPGFGFLKVTKNV